MDSYKLAPGPVIVKEITVANFEADTKKKLPYYVDENLQYAVCPRCDNPIQILGLYKKLQNTDKPFGRHVAKSIAHLAKYDQEAYDFCPLARPQHPNPEARRRNTAKTPAHLLVLLKEQFDRIVYILRRDTDILFSPNLLARMLTTFIKAEGYAYSWASANNLPWTFMHMSFAHSLYGQKIREDSDLKKAILQNVPEASFDKNGRLIAEAGTYLSPLTFCFMNHQLAMKNGTLDESFDFVVSQQAKDSRETRDVFCKTLFIDQSYFLNLINLPPERAKREERLLDLVKEHL